ncbi:MAG TPA: hypothetical protein VD816_00295 [Ohtaekwangia sp.]|nr:hypothetical protein [Ohtaekwangia sp.]
MIEASPVKFYFAKYFFLAFAFIQWTAGGVLLFGQPFGPKNFFAALIFFTLGLIFLFIFSIISDKIRRVAVGKNKIVVFEGQRNIRFNWPEVKSLQIVPFLNLYKLRIKGKKGSIYFFPSRNIDPAFGLLSKDTSKMGEIVAKRKKELGIK